MWTAAVFFGRVKVMEMVMRCDAGHWWRRLMRLHQLGESFLIKFNSPPAPLDSSSSLPMMATSHKKLSLVYDSVPFRSAPKNYLKSKFLLISKAFYWTFAIFWCEHGKILCHPPFPLPLLLVTTAGTEQRNGRSASEAMRWPESANQSCLHKAIIFDWSELRSNAAVVFAQKVQC